MKAIPAVGAVVALVASVFVLRIALHGYTDHGHLDIFHLVVGIGTASLGILLVRRALSSRGT